MTEREPGLYWVKRYVISDGKAYSQWEPAEWSEDTQCYTGNVWWVLGYDAPMSDRAFAEIGERIERKVET